MIIEKITLSNWLSFPAKWEQNGQFVEPNLHFDQEQVYLIFGKNGAGKSSIMEAILFALFGDYSRASERQDIKREGAIRTGEKTATIELIFKLNEQRYKINRILDKKTTKAQYFSWDAIGQKWIMESSQVKIVNAKIIKLLGMNQDLFCGTVILEQGKTGRFMELKSGEQVDHVKNLLGLNIYSMYFEKAKELANQRKSDVRKIEEELEKLTEVTKKTLEKAENEVRRLEGILKKIDSDIRFLDQLHTKVQIIEGIRRELSDVSHRITEYETQLNNKHEIETAAQIVKDWQQIEPFLREIKQAQKQLSDQQNRLTDIQDEFEKKQSEIFINQKALDEKHKPNHQEIEGKLIETKESQKVVGEKLAKSKDHRDLIKSELDLDCRHSELQTLQEEKHQQLYDLTQVEADYHLWTELNKATPKLENIVSNLINNHDEATAVSKSQQLLTEDLNNLKARRTAFDKLKEQSEVLGEELEAVKEREESIRSEWNTNKELLEKRKDAHGQSKCPTCGTSLMGKELDRFHRELLELRDKVNSGESALVEAHKRMLQIKEEARKIEKQYRQEEKAIEREDSRLTNEQRNLESRKKHAENQEQEAHMQWKELKGSLNYSVQIIKDPTKESLKRARNQLEALTNIQKRYNRLIQTQADFNAAQVELDKIKGQRQYPIGTFSQSQLDEVDKTVNELIEKLEQSKLKLEAEGREERKLYQLLTETENKIIVLSERIQIIEEKLMPQEQKVFEENKCYKEETLNRFGECLTSIDWSKPHLEILQKAENGDRRSEQKIRSWVDEHRPLALQLSQSKEAENKIEGLRSRYTTLDEQIKKYPDDVQKGKSKIIENKLEKKRKERDEKQKQYEQGKEKCWEENTRLSQKRKLQDEYILRTREEKNFRDLASLLEPPGPRSPGGPLLQEIMRDALKNVAKGASDILDEWGQSTQIIIPNDALEFRVIDLASGSSERHFQLFSGGEKFMVALAMALAIGEVASDRGHTDCLVIDEGFGLLDKENRAYVAQEIINKLVRSGRRKQVVVITHMEDVQEAFPDRRARYHLVNDGTATRLLVGEEDAST